ncbi:MAG: MliC family protein [Alysiella sp.]|uniref:MliC family protein n=1 Tax=Alysiella sp. TaxID=1872483 RepID=UPI0026DD7D36|nr:MliC family protein [Alysiella sp.]MDO4434650.1 MliC family protein [Alysiella sp.]
MNKKLIASLSLAVLLAACAGNKSATQSVHRHEHAHHHGHAHHHHDHKHHHGHDHAYNHAAPDSQSFECANGATVQVHNAGKDKIHITVDTIGKTVVLSQASSGSGERYTSQKGFYNNATEWHQKGNKMGHLTFTDPYNNRVSTACDSK